MDAHSYQVETQRTATLHDTALAQGKPAEIAFYWMACAAGEVGETINKLKKVVGHKFPLDRQALISELGDVLWYLMQVCSALDIDVNEVMEYNLQKLARRYPDGFDPERSKNRES